MASEAGGSGEGDEGGGDSDGGAEEGEFFVQADYERQLEQRDIEPEGDAEEPWLQAIEPEEADTAEFALDGAGRLCFSNASVSNPWRQTGFITMQQQVEVLEDGMVGELTADQRAVVNRVERNGRRLLLLVEDLLLLSQIEAREMRMTTTEVKRERKDQDGNPQIKGAIRRQQRESAQGGPKLGFDRATLLICGQGQVVGLRYVRGETDFPLVVCRATGARADEFVANGRAHALPVFWDDDLARMMLMKLQLGRPVTAEFFQRVAQVLYASGAVR